MSIHIKLYFLYLHVYLQASADLTRKVNQTSECSPFKIVYAFKTYDYSTFEHHETTCIEISKLRNIYTATSITSFYIIQHHKSRKNKPVSGQHYQQCWQQQYQNVLLCRHYK